MDERYKLLQGNAVDVLKTLPDCSADCCITSPPYYCLRDYGCEGQIGLEETPEQFIERLVDVFHEVKRVLKNDGTCWINIGDTYNGNKLGNDDYIKHKVVATKSFAKKKWSGAKEKDLIGIPWMLAFALRADGWYLRQDIIWAKPNPMPEPIKDRCTKSHEHIFLLSKNPTYFFDYKAIQEDACESARTGSRFGGTKYGDNDDPRFRIYSGNEYESNEKRNKRDVWSVSQSSGYSDEESGHFATFNPKLIEPCVLAGCRWGGVILDPFNGTGTTGVVALNNGRNYVGIDLNKDYIEMSERRIKKETAQYSLFTMIEQKEEQEE